MVFRHGGSGSRWRRRAERGERGSGGGVQPRGFRPSRARAWSGVATVAPSNSVICTARSTSCAVGRLDALAEVEVVLQADPHVAAEQDRLGDPRHLHPAEREARPLGALGQHVDHRLEDARVGRRAPRDAHAQLEDGRVVQQPLGQQLLGEPQLTGVEDLQLGPYAQLLDALGARPQHVGGGDVEVGAVAEVEGAAVQGADVGQQFLDVRAAARGRSTRSVPGSAVSGSSGSMTRSPPMPAVRLMTTSVPVSLIRSTTSRYSRGSREGSPVSGSRTWMCTTAAPASAASTADAAICSGVTGTCGLRRTVSPAPVSAQVMMTSWFTGVPSVRGSSGLGAWLGARARYEGGSG